MLIKRKCCILILILVFLFQSFVMTVFAEDNDNTNNPDAINTLEANNIETVPNTLEKNPSSQLENGDIPANRFIIKFFRHFTFLRILY